MTSDPYPDSERRSVSPLDVPPEIAARNALRDSYETVMFGSIDDLDLDALVDQLEDRGWRWTG